MSEQATLIRSVPAIKEPEPKVVEKIAPSGSNPSVNLGSTPPKTSGEGVQGGGAFALEPSTPSEEPGASITPFQGVTYASFIMTFCLAGFAAIVVFRKALKASVKRFSIGAKMLSLAYLVVAFNSFFGTYLYSKFLNGEDTSIPLTIPILSWILVGPAIAVVLNSLLTREDVPSAKKMIFDAFTYLIIFGCVVASQIPSLGAKEPLVFSFFGAFFFIVPIVRFSISLKMAKEYHPELKEMFVQLLIRCLLILPLLLPSLVFANVYELTSDGLTMLLFNLVTFVFVLMTGLLMVISIDYITQGIGAEQLVAKKIDAPVTAPDRKLSIPSSQSNRPTASVSLETPANPTEQEMSEQASAKSVKSESPADSVVPSSSEKYSEPVDDPFEESSEISDFDVEPHDSTVIEFKASQSSEDESRINVTDSSKSKRLKIGSPDSKSNLAKNEKLPQRPKAPPPPDASKSSDSKPGIKPPEKPKKRF